LAPLTPLEARVLGVLVEKAATVPDSYPLSLNTLVLGCNQKTARDPVIAASEAEVQSAVDGLRSRALVVESSGSRVTRYEHNAARVLGLPAQSVALLAVLALRGPQTASALRANSERLHRFADLSSVEGFLDELAARSEERGGSLVIRLSRSPGEREARWAQLLTGPLDAASLSPALADANNAAEQVGVGELSALKARLAVTEAEVSALRDRVARLEAELGVTPP